MHYYYIYLTDEETEGQSAFWIWVLSDTCITDKKYSAGYGGARL